MTEPVETSQFVLATHYDDNITLQLAKHLTNSHILSGRVGRLNYTFCNSLSKKEIEEYLHICTFFNFTHNHGLED